METIELHGNVYSGNCPARQVLDRISDKWTALIIGVLEEGTMRFSDIQRRIGGISQKMLTQTLRQLERDGLVTRTVYAEVPPRVEYTLTPLGASLTEALATLRYWAEANIEAVSLAQKTYDSLSEDKAPAQGA
ncbi:MAG: helix-turn-helix domain-containing protein [Anaerolineae bacterium]